MGVHDCVNFGAGGVDGQMGRILDRRQQVGKLMILAEAVHRLPRALGDAAQKREDRLGLVVRFQLGPPGFRRSY